MFYYFTFQVPDVSVSWINTDNSSSRQGVHEDYVACIVDNTLTFFKYSMQIVYAESQVAFEVWF